MISKVLILGVGNILRRDDGIGPRVIDYFCDHHDEISVDCDLIDGGTEGLALIDILSKYQRAIIVDAVDMGMPLAAIRTFSPSEAKILVKRDALSTHGFGLAEVIALLERLEIKVQILIIGVQPCDLNFGEDFSPEIANKFRDVINAVKAGINRF